METRWVTVEERDVEVDRRHLKMMSAQAVRSVVEALVELITNSDDAYRKAGDEKGKVGIEVTRHRGEKSGVVVVKDRASGMTQEEMKKKILRYGAFSAEAKSRGFMGRGAKDIVALGSAVFQAIKDGMIHQVELDPEFHSSVKQSQEANPQDYADHGVKPGKGGMKVTLEVQKRHKVPLHETLARDLQRHYALRDILSRREIRLTDSKSRKQQTLKYIPPEGDLVRDESLKFESPYEGATARLQLFRAQQELSSELQEGVIVTDGWAVHQVTRFASELDEDPIARRFFGRLECGHIRNLQLEFEDRRTRGEAPSSDNPVDILDPSRRRGLDRAAHPFVMKLFEWAEEVVRGAVQEVTEEVAKEHAPPASEQTKKRLKDLSKAVADHLKTRIEDETLRPKTPEQEAALHNEGVLLNPQFERIEVGEARRLGYTVLSFGEAEDPDHVTVDVEGDALDVAPANPPLRPQKRNADRLSAYFEITGRRVGEVTLTVRHASELIQPVLRHIEVTEPADPFANMPYGIFFERQNYTVHDSGIRTLTFLARGRRFRTVDWARRDLANSSKPEAVTILRGGSLSVQALRKDIWKGDLQVRGQGVGRSSIVSVGVPTNDGLQTANARVRVAHKEEPAEVSIQIELVPERRGQWRAAWDDQNPNLLKVFMEHPTLARYLGPRDKRYPGQENLHFRVLLAEIVADKVVQRILEAREESDRRLLEDAHKFLYIYSEEMNFFLPIAHNIMVSDSDVAQLAQGYDRALMPLAKSGIRTDRPFR